VHTVFVRFAIVKAFAHDFSRFDALGRAWEVGGGIVLPSWDSPEFHLYEGNSGESHYIGYVFFCRTPTLGDHLQSLCNNLARSVKFA
jgi:hypothetical protein